ncbi:MAG TPA: hypothetical protein VJZ71_11785 [Phycisphaerae bacterium]|nr:hypothetical protein [Phycisphaerae bacterium]
MARRIVAIVLGLPVVLPPIPGCANEYKGVIKPTPDLKSLSPELENMTDAAIDHLLSTNVEPDFPAVVAVAKLNAGYSHPFYNRQDSLSLEMPSGDETDAWRKAADAARFGNLALVDQVHVVNPLISRRAPTLKELRDSAALLHANLLVVYAQGDSADSGYNSAAIAYWSIIGLFLVPGDTVGHHTACYGLVMDTRTGYILAVLDGDSKKEENVLPGAVPIARRRTQSQAQAQALERLQKRFTEALVSLGRGGDEPAAAKAQ